MFRRRGITDYAPRIVPRFSRPPRSAMGELSASRFVCPRRHPIPWISRRHWSTVSPSVPSPSNASSSHQHHHRRHIPRHHNFWRPTSNSRRRIIDGRRRTCSVTTTSKSIFKGKRSSWKVVDVSPPHDPCAIDQIIATAKGRPRRHRRCRSIERFLESCNQRRISRNLTIMLFFFITISCHHTLYPMDLSWCFLSTTSSTTMIWRSG